MATEKQVKGVLIPRHDTAINWAKAVNFVPKKGELIIFDADAASANYTLSNVSNKTMKNADGTTGALTACNPSTQVRIKIGNGNLNVNLLPFVKTDVTADDLADYYTKDEIDTVLAGLNDDIVVSATEPIVTGETIWLQPITTDTGSVDYIIEQGIDGANGSYYEKWNSGIMKYYAKELLPQSTIYGSHDVFMGSFSIPTFKNIIDYKISAYPAYNADYNDWQVEISANIIQLDIQAGGTTLCKYKLRSIGSYNDYYNLDDVDSITVMHSIIGFWK